MALVCTGGLAVLVAACGSIGAASTTTSAPFSYVPASGGTLTAAIDQAPTGCNPNAMGGRGATTADVLSPVLPSAFVASGTGQAVVDQALLTQAETVSLAPQKVVYTINPKAVWSDGTPITAADFIYAWQQQRGTGSAPSFVADPATSILGYRDIASVVPSNKGLTVTVTFTKPFADWRTLFSDLLPAHIMEKVGWNPSCAAIDPAIDLSGGPFVLSSVSPSQITMVRNPKWWGIPADLDRLVIRIASSPAQAASLFRRGTVQVAQPSSYTEAVLNELTSNPSAQTGQKISSSIVQLEFSTTAPATAAVGVRQAIAHAVDRQALVNSVVGWSLGSIVPAQSHIFSQSSPYYPAPPTVPDPAVSGTTTTLAPSTGAYADTADLAATDRLLAAAGDVRAADGTWIQPGGGPFTVRLVVDAGDSWASSASPLVVAALEHAGIGVTVSTAPDAIATGMALATGTDDMALLPFVTNPYPTLAGAWYSLSLGPPGQYGSQGWSNFNDPTLNSLLDQAAQQLNPVTAAPIYAQADTVLWNDMVALPLFAEPVALGWSVYTNGVTTSLYQNGLFWNAEQWAVTVKEPSSYTGTPTIPAGQ